MTMRLWHALECPYSMRARLMLREKDQAYDSRVVSLDQLGGEVGDELRRLNPKGSVPVLQDGDCVIYEADIIAEYLEERFPDPPLYPKDPAQRARARMLLDWIDQTLMGPIKRLEQAHTEGGLVGEPVQDPELQDALRQAYAGLHTIADQVHPDGFMLGEFGVVDVFLAPLVVGAHAISLRRDDIPAAAASWIDRLRDRPSVSVEAQRRLQAMGLWDETETQAG